jgi:hypothetical protein
MTRELSPNSTVVLGGHVSAIPGIESMVDADYIVKVMALLGCANSAAKIQRRLFAIPKLCRHLATASWV